MKHEIIQSIIAILSYDVYDFGADIENYKHQIEYQDIQLEILYSLSLLK